MLEMNLKFTKSYMFKIQSTAHTLQQQKETKHPCFSYRLINTLSLHK